MVSLSLSPLHMHKDTHMLVLWIWELHGYVHPDQMVTFSMTVTVNCYYVLSFYQCLQACEMLVCVLLVFNMVIAIVIFIHLFQG